VKAVRSNRCPGARRATLLFALLLWAVAAHSETTSPTLNWHELLTDPDPVQLTALAGQYEQAIGYRRDYGRALQLYCAAARLGYPPAQRRLARMYAYGLGAPRDRPLAAAWLKVAAAAGDLKAGKLLALLNVQQTGRQPRCNYESRSNADATATSQEPEQAANSNTATSQEPKLSANTNTATSQEPKLAANINTATSEHSQIVSWIHQLAPHYGLDPNLILAIIQTPPSFTSESRPETHVPGLMQFTSATAASIGIKDPTDPLQNLNGGMAYISWLLSSFDGDLRLSLASYHAGEDAVEKYQGVPPYPETQSYIEKVLRAYGRDTHPPIDPAVEP
jgi:soluble lytic murein transglycosylase-like protein